MVYNMQPDITNTGGGTIGHSQDKSDGGNWLFIQSVFSFLRELL